MKYKKFYKYLQTRSKDSIYNDYQVTKDTFFLWLNEIDLLLTNLEYLSTKELQLKYNEIQVSKFKQSAVFPLR